MKASLRSLILPVFIFSLIAFFYACQKEQSVSSNSDIPSGQARFSLFLTDGPYDFQKVMIQIKSIELKIDTCHRFGDKDDDDDDRNHSGNDDHRHHHGNCDNHDGDHDGDRKDSVGHCEIWVKLQINPGIYDILKLRNGIDTMMGITYIPKGKIKQIRILLGNDNSITSDNITRPLKIRDNKFYVSVNVRNEHLDSISLNNFQIILDFNLAKSIRFENDIFWLRPEICVFAKKNTGSIEGRIRPDSSFGIIKAFNAIDTGYALPDREHEGNFKIRGLREGIYTVWIDGINNYKDSTIYNVKVYPKKETDLGRIVLKK